MSRQIVVQKGRLTVVTVDIGVDLTGDVVTSHIRKRPSQDSDLICNWDVAITDEENGLVTLTIDTATADAITDSVGWMDIIREIGGEDIPVFDYPVPVEFRGSVTA